MGSAVSRTPGAAKTVTEDETTSQAMEETPNESRETSESSQSQPNIIYKDIDDTSDTTNNLTFTSRLQSYPSDSLNLIDPEKSITESTIETRNQSSREIIRDQPNSTTQFDMLADEQQSLETRDNDITIVKNDEKADIESTIGTRNQSSREINRDQPNSTTQFDMLTDEQSLETRDNDITIVKNDEKADIESQTSNQEQAFPHDTTTNVDLDIVADNQAYEVTRERSISDDADQELEGDISAESSSTRENLDTFKVIMDGKREERKKIMIQVAEEMNTLRQCKDDLMKETLIREGLDKQVIALKEVAQVSNQMLLLRETQVEDLRKRLKMMEESATSDLKEMREQYEKQIDNIRRLRQLYEERSNAITRGHQREIEKEQAKNRLLELKVLEQEATIGQIPILQRKIDSLERTVEDKNEEIDRVKDDLFSRASECKLLTDQMNLINNLFSNLLTGNDLDFDLLTKLLQDNHNLITDLIANGDINDTVSLLINIGQKVYKSENKASRSSEEAANPSELNVCPNDEPGCKADKAESCSNARDEIASNLPKVWRVLIELLNQHEESLPPVQGGSEDCYKMVKTPHGSRTVISVSQTFLKLKDLILEKNSLVKEVGKLKTLNGHLENRLELQEKRLFVVSSELRKTWGIVSKLKVQHRQLHTQEKILRFELQRKRETLNDLKDKLEDCKETWDRAKEKNIQTEHDWEILRQEFALRKLTRGCNSLESGYDEDGTTSPSPEISTSESESDLSKSDELESDPIEDQIDLEDGAASDATVIELMDLLEDDFERENNINESTIDDSQTVEEEPDTENCGPSTSAEDGPPSTEERLKARADRLKRLERQCKSLLNQMTLTSLRSETLSTRLEELHEQYGSSERPPSSEESESSFDESTNEPDVDGTAIIGVNYPLDSHHLSDIAEENLPTTSESSDENERLVERAERVKKMETECLELFSNASGSTTKLESELDDLQKQLSSSDENPIIGESKVDAIENSSSENERNDKTDRKRACDSESVVENTENAMENPNARAEKSAENENLIRTSSTDSFSSLKNTENNPKENLSRESNNPKCELSNLNSPDDINNRVVSPSIASSSESSKTDDQNDATKPGNLSQDETYNKRKILERRLSKSICDFLEKTSDYEYLKIATAKRRHSTGSRLPSRPKPNSMDHSSDNHNRPSSSLAFTAESTVFTRRFVIPEDSVDNETVD